MKIKNLCVNHMTNPIGYDTSIMNLSWRIIENRGQWSHLLRVLVSEGRNEEHIVYDSGILEDYHENQLTVTFDKKPRTRYYWRVEITDDTGEAARSEWAYFETGKEREEWSAKWIGTPEDPKHMPFMYKQIHLLEKPVSARWYGTGVGLYELYINGQSASEEYLMPGYHSYDQMLEYQTIDLDKQLDVGSNAIGILLGEGWYKGRFGFDDVYYDLYGNQKMCMGEIWITYQDGREECITTDLTWQAWESSVGQNGIYDGEIVDYTGRNEQLKVTCFEPEQVSIVPRTNMPICKVEAFQPVNIEQLSENRILLDYGEAITGWVELHGHVDKNQTLTLSYGEVLQNGEFYRDNLRTAKARFRCTGDGHHDTTRPHFTYYGFRYVLVEGLKNGQKIDFTAYRLMSDIVQTGHVVTSNEKVNQLFENTLRSQKCNFLDIPTDCPQRDERMGWTGDAGIFSATACFHMDCINFFRHYMKNLEAEQSLLNGAVPFFVPRPKVPVRENTNPFYKDAGIAVWGDAAWMIPWNLYQFYGEKSLLSEQYQTVKNWVEYVTSRAALNENPYLWQNDRQLGDWLALDNGNIHNPIGKTDSGLIASAYYYWAVKNLVKITEIVQADETQKYEILEQNIRKAFLSYYFSEDNQLKAEKTQTACALLLHIGLYPLAAKERLIQLLGELLNGNQNHLNTGFVGTPILCPALTENGKNDLAYTLLLNEEYPGWLYEINMGATTIWERWNSLEADGTISGTGMNSLNHYAYGSIAEWMYRYMCGFHPTMGEKVKMTIKPHPDHRMGQAKGSWNTIYGTYRSEWKWINEEVYYQFEIPFNTNARIILDDGTDMILGCGVYEKTNCGVHLCNQF